MEDHARGCDARNSVCSCGYERHQDEEIERLRSIVLRDAKEKLRQLVEWMSEDEDRVDILLAALSEDDIANLRNALSSTKPE